jgi:hypothetical protein
LLRPEDALERNVRFGIDKPHSGLCNCLRTGEKLKLLPQQLRA